MKTDEGNVSSEEHLAGSDRCIRTPLDGLSGLRIFTPGQHDLVRLRLTGVSRPFEELNQGSITPTFVKSLQNQGPFQALWHRLERFLPICVYLNSGLQGSCLKGAWVGIADDQGIARIQWLDQWNVVHTTGAQ